MVDTQFYGGPSAIVEAGAFAGCTSVKNLWGAAEAVSPERRLFTGEKRLSCAGDTVTVYYEATQDTASGKRTMGTWYVTESTVAGATSGGGTLRGDNTACTIAKNSGGCILDTFTGDVS